MAKSVEEIIQEIDNNEKKIKKYEQKINRTKQKLAKEETSLTQLERRARTHRFCEIGGAIESEAILGRQLNDDDIPAIISFLADQEARGHFLSNWILYHSPHTPEEPPKEIKEKNTEEEMPPDEEHE